MFAAWKFCMSGILPWLLGASQVFLLNHSALVWEKMIKPIAATTQGWSYKTWLLCASLFTYAFCCPVVADALFMSGMRTAVPALSERLAPLWEHSVLLHLCHAFATHWKDEARRFREMSAWDGCEASCVSPSTRRNITLNWFVVFKTTIPMNVS